MEKATQPEPWLRGTMPDVPAVLRAVLHALELAQEDLRRWCGALTDEQMHVRPHGLAPVAFHLRHIARSCDRLLTYAEGQSLSERQLSELKSEMDGPGTRDAIFAEFEARLASTAERVKKFGTETLEEPRAVGKKALPTTVGGLLIHVADHTQRHVGQAITTAKIVKDYPSARPD